MARPCRVADFDAIFAFPKVALEACLADKTVDEASLRHIIQHLVVTTAYSGIGGAEAVLPMIVHELNLRRDEALCRGGRSCATGGGAPAGGGAPKEETDTRRERHSPIPIWRAADKNATCRRILLEHKEESRASHLMCDLTKRVEPTVSTQLAHYQNRLRALYTERTRNMDGRPEKRNLRERLSRKFLASAKRLLGHRELARSGHCVVHNKMCPWEPAVAEPCTYRLEIAGVTCVSWSTRGCGLGWLHPSALPCLVWLEGIRRSKPSLVICECTPAFPDHDVQVYLDEYIVQPMITSPVDFGIPTQRKRKYTLMWHAKTVPPLAEVERLQARVKRTWCTPCCLEGDVYLRATDAALDRALMASGGGAPAALGERDLLNIWSPAMRRRAEDYLERYYGGSKAVRSGVTAIADVSQNAERSDNRFARFIPTLCRNTSLLCVDRRRPFLPCEYFAMQGILVRSPSLLPACAAEVHYPFARSLEDMGLSDGLVRRLCGNGMHLSQVLVAVLAIISMARPKDCRAGAAAPRPQRPLALCESTSTLATAPKSKRPASRESDGETTLSMAPRSAGSSGRGRPTASSQPRLARSRSRSRSSVSSFLRRRPLFPRTEDSAERGAAIGRPAVMGEPHSPLSQGRSWDSFEAERVAEPPFSSARSGECSEDMRLVETWVWE